MALPRPSFSSRSKEGLKPLPRGPGAARRRSASGSFTFLARRVKSPLRSGDNLRPCTFGPPGIKRWRGRIFDAKLHHFRKLRTCDLTDHGQCHVNSGGNAAARNEIAVADDAPRIRHSSEDGQHVSPGPVTSGAFAL